MTQALDTFNAALVSPIYYALFTSLTIFASAIMFKVSLIHSLEAICILISECIIFFSFCFSRIGLVRVLAILCQCFADS
jgi:hypothetical protein